MKELLAYRKSKGSYLISIHLGCKIILWEFSCSNPHKQTLGNFEMDQLNEIYDGNVLLSTESGGVIRDKFDLPVQIKQRGESSKDII